MSDRYADFLDQVIADTLAGKIQSEGQLERLLSDRIEAGTGELFERNLESRMASLKATVDQEEDELKQAKATRKLRALKKLKSAWERGQKQRQATDACTSAVQQILRAEPSDRLTVLTQALDPNQNIAFNQSHLRQLARALRQNADQASETTEAAILCQFASGLEHGIRSFQTLESHIVSWIYETNRSVGFGAEAQTQVGPWKLWSQKVPRPFLTHFFSVQAANKPASEAVTDWDGLDYSDWVELAVVLRGLQGGLVNWFDNQPLNIQAGRNLSSATFMSFAVIWSELSQGFHQLEAAAGDSAEERRENRLAFAQASFQIALQILRTFAQRDNFPLYGGVFASFSGTGFRQSLTYLDQPLKSVENVQEKARILTVLAYSQRLLGQAREAIALHEQALELARQAGDRRCEVANLNHLSRLQIDSNNYEQAMAPARLALILSRQEGDRLGEANALVSLGYGEVMTQRHQPTAVTAETLESALANLNAAQGMFEKFQFSDLPSQALISLGLGVASMLLDRPNEARPVLERGLLAWQKMGDRDRQGIAHAYLGEACYALQDIDGTLYHGALAMYVLEQRGNTTWRQAAALLAIVQGQLGADAFDRQLKQRRGDLIAQIGVDGFDYLPTLLQRFRED
ncbi:MAG: tetratricopeptide repeat protein [Cyanobacteria bacterium J06638_20]